MESNEKDRIYRIIGMLEACSHELRVLQAKEEEGAMIPAIEGMADAKEALSLYVNECTAASGNFEYAHVSLGKAVDDNTPIREHYVATLDNPGDFKPVDYDDVDALAENHMLGEEPLGTVELEDEPRER